MDLACPNFVAYKASITDWNSIDATGNVLSRNQCFRGKDVLHVLSVSIVKLKWFTFYSVY
jgi:hypothetical protein